MSDTSKSIINKVKGFYLKNKRFPSNSELVGELQVPRTTMRHIFKNLTNLIEIVARELERPVTKATKTKEAKMSNSKVFVISDTHFPFHSKKAYKVMMAKLKKEKPTHVVQVGDILDQFIFSKYPKSDTINFDSDVKLGLEVAKKMWKDIQAAVPKAKCYQLLGNHDVRMVKRISEKLPELHNLISNKDLYDFEGVETKFSDRDYLEIDGVVYVHGWLSKSLDHATYFGKPVVHGHTHRAGIQHHSQDLWAMDVGYLADKDSLPLQYTASKFSKWTVACGIVEDGRPRLVYLD